MQRYMKFFNYTQRDKNSLDEAVSKGEASRHSRKSGNLLSIVNN
jgi:hypothetical protein